MNKPCPWLLMALVCSFLAACDMPAGKLAFPPLGEIDHLVVHDISEPTSAGTTTDPKQVQAFVELFEAQNAGWRKPWDTFPLPNYSVSLRDAHDQELIVAFIGQGWIGARQRNEDSKRNRMHNLSAEERIEMLRALGMPDVDWGSIE